MCKYGGYRKFLVVVWSWRSEGPGPLVLQHQKKKVDEKLKKFWSHHADQTLCVILEGIGGEYSGSRVMLWHLFTNLISWPDIGPGLAVTRKRRKVVRKVTADMRESLQGRLVAERENFVEDFSMVGSNFLYYWCDLCWSKVCWNCRRCSSVRCPTWTQGKLKINDCTE